MCLRTFLPGIFLVFSWTLAFSQHTVSGNITDKEDKTKLLEGVSVYMPEFNLYDISREGGTYILRNVGVGVVNIQFSLVGYKTIVRTIDTKDSATVLSIEMESSSIELEEVAITGNSSKLPGNIPYPLTTYNANDLKRTGAMNSLSALAMQPGIDKITLGTGITKPVIRGLSFNQILLYQYGTRIDNQPWDDRHDLGINENGVDKIEVIRGPSALIYGADAMGGALIFIDEKPAVPGTIAGDVNIGFHSNTIGLVSEAGIKGNTNNGLFYSARIGEQSHTSYVQGEGDTTHINTEERPFAANSKFNSLNAKMVAGISRKWGVSKLTYSFLHQQIGIVELENDSISAIGVQDPEQRDRGMEAPYQDVSSHIVSVENTIILGVSKFNFNISYQYNNRKEFEPLPDKGKETAIGLRLNTLTYDLKYTSNAGKKFGYTLGSQGSVQSNRNFGLDGLVPDADVNNVAGYLLLRYDLPKWNFLAGGRIDARTMKMKSYESPQNKDTTGTVPVINVDNNFQLANASLGLAFHPYRDITIKLNGASGFTAPNYAQLGTYGKHEGTYRFEAGNLNLVAEQNIEGDAGLIWETPTLAINLDAYSNKIYNYIYLYNSGGYKAVNIDGKDSLLPFYEYRQKDAVISGAELSFDIHPASLKWMDLLLSYGLVKGKFDDGGNVPYIPAQKLVTALKLQKKRMNYVLNPYVTLVLENYFKQDLVSDYETKTSAYTLVNLHLGGNFKWTHQVFEVTLSVNNLLNKGYYNHLSLVRNIGVREMGRNVVLNLRLPFGVKSRK